MTHQLKSLLICNQELRPLLTKAHELKVLQHHFIAVAPPNLAQSSQVLGLQLGTLSIAVANATIAAKLRQLGPELAALLRGRGCEISGIRVKVQVSYNHSPPKPAPRRLGKMAQNSLNELSCSLPDDSILKLTLEKMIKTKG
ncbi:MAG: hypothetical protein A3H31_10670 [Gallionellales bacterium RIFCSPLOWO2_02_FULL_57_47]|nr:MAG: hypothetical protein A3H31_10670 [Gallionellales bacterium RIFCSPLOWO2_02_FULL_57_47]